MKRSERRSDGEAFNKFFRRTWWVGTEWHRSAVAWTIALYGWCVLVYGAYLYFFRSPVTTQPGDVSTEVVEEAVKAMQSITARLDDIDDRLAEVEAGFAMSPDDIRKINEAVAAVDSLATAGGDDAGGNFISVVEKVSQLDGDVQSLKGAINPSDPTDVLTVARLGDQFVIVSERLLKFESEVERIERTTEENAKRNFDLVNAQVDRIVDMLKWLGLLLIPALFNMVKNAFDFYGGGRGKKKQEPGEQKKGSDGGSDDSAQDEEVKSLPG